MQRRYSDTKMLTCLITCLHPPLAAVPFEDWFCQECATDDSHTNDSFSRVEREIAEAEMMDLLSDVVPTSSRLRHSTTAQHAVSVHRRRSERVRAQRNRTHTTPPPQSAQVPFSVWNILVILILGSLYCMITIAIYRFSNILFRY